MGEDGRLKKLDFKGFQVNRSGEEALSSGSQVVANLVTQHNEIK